MENTALANVNTSIKNAEVLVPKKDYFNISDSEWNLKINNIKISNSTTEELDELLDSVCQKEERSAEPIKDISIVNQICQYFLNKNNFRNYMLFVIGINTGLRCVDLRQLRYFQFLDINPVNNSIIFREELVVLEQKTQKTNPNRHIPINEAIKRAVQLVLNHSIDISLGDYMFRSTSNRQTENKPMDRRSVDYIIRDMKEDLGIEAKGATHIIRKTFGYHFISKNKDYKANEAYSNPAVERLLQIAFNHADIADTHRYTGISKEDLKNAYLNLNLGMVEMQYINNFNNSKSTGHVFTDENGKNYRYFVK